MFTHSWSWSLLMPYYTTRSRSVAVEISRLWERVRRCCYYNKKKKHQLFPPIVASVFFPSNIAVFAPFPNQWAHKKFDLGISSHGEQGPRKQVQRTEPVALSCTRMNTDRSGDKKGCLASCQFPAFNSFLFTQKKCLTFAGVRWSKGGNAIKSPRRTPAHRAALYPYLSA